MRSIQPGRSPVESLAGRLRASLPGWAVQAACLERMTPCIAETLDWLAAEGAAEIALLPVFWSAQGHVDHTVPLLAERLQVKGIPLRALPVLSELPGMLDTVAATARMVFLKA